MGSVKKGRKGENKMTYKCKSCGKPTDRRYAGMCQGCYNYFKKGGNIYELPPFGTISKDERGYVICHICGRSYKRLGSHIKESHNMTIDEYKEEFGLCRRAKTTEKNYSETMRCHAINNEMPKRLRVIGENTRIKPGQVNMRKGKSVRLQEIIEKKRRKNK